MITNRYKLLATKLLATGCNNAKHKGSFVAPKQNQIGRKGVSTVRGSEWVKHRD